MLSVQGPGSQRELVVATTRDGLAAVDAAAVAAADPSLSPSARASANLPRRRASLPRCLLSGVLRTTVYGR